LPLIVFTQRDFVADILQAKCDFFTEIGRLAFQRPPLEDLGATYDDDHLRLIGKPVVDFLLALIERFSLGVTAEALRAIIGSKSAILLQRGPVDPKFQVEGVAPTNTNHSSSQKTRLNDLSYGIKICTDISTVLSQFTRVTDGRTDRRTEFSSLYRVCITCSAVKNDQIRYQCKKPPITRRLIASYVFEPGAVVAFLR